ncbi:hypothetical protein RUND412_000692 [Rhizina undulata]
MCGILFKLSPTPGTPSATLKRLISRRGPDSTRTHTTAFPSNSPTHHLTFTASVLSLRGDHIAVQPLVDNLSSSVLCWNGEAWRISGEPLERGVNDGEAIFRLLLLSTSSPSEDEVAKVFENVSGPFAFVFWDARRGRLWWGRDCLGRRSLVYRWDEFGALVVASVGDGREGWREVEADGVYYLDLGTAAVGEGHVWRVGWVFEDEVQEGLSMTFPFPKLNMAVPDESLSLTTDSTEVQQLRNLLLESVKLRVQDIPEPPYSSDGNSGVRKSRLAILFSGGLDCTVLARCVHEVLPLDKPVDLINVGFENRRILEGLEREAKLKAKGKKEKAKLKSKGKGKWKKQNEEQQGETDMAPESLESAPEIIIEPQNSLSPRKISEDDVNAIYELCPDRITGRKSFAELRKVCSEREWRFVEVNVPYVELQEHRQTVIELIHPHNTEMDLSIALAFYFASRGSGIMISSSCDSVASMTQYTTTSRILLSGLGADELLAGYARHATAYRFRSYPGLLAELELDMMRLGKRNLGRDDRVLAHWGREGRYPFLDEKVVKWCLETRVDGKCSFAHYDSKDGEDEAGKKLLREVARSFGMEGVAAEKKRAVQFGARTARMEGGKMKGTQTLS